MKRILAWSAALALGACSSEAPDDKPLASTYKITGKVQAADTQAALTGVLVYAEGGQSAKTGGDGAFSLSLTKGPHTLSAKLDGFQTQQVQINVTGDLQVPAILLNPVGTDTNAKLSITSVAPASAAGGALVTLQGVGFEVDGETTSVMFGAAEAVPDSVADGVIKVKVPSDVTAGEVALNVKVGAFHSNDKLFIVLPLIGSLTDGSTYTGEDVVLVHGTNFGTGQGASTVKAGPVNLAVKSWAMNTVGVWLPADMAAGYHPITLKVGGQTSNAISWALPPRLTGVSASVVSGGDVVTISGVHFGTAPTGNTVSFGNVYAPIAAWSRTAIAVTVPADALPGTRAVDLVVNGIVKLGPNVEVKPKITNLSPQSGPVGGSVVISGVNFGATQGTVSFGGTPAAVSAWTHESITVAVPAGLSIGSYDIAVNAGGLASTGVAFGVSAAITGINISSGSGGTPFTLTGTSFGISQGANRVVIGGVAANVTSWSDTSVSATIPDGVTGGTQPVGVVVSDQLSNTFNVTIIPQIASRSPAIGQGGATISFNGRNFGVSQGVSTLTFGSVPTSATYWSSTLIQAKIPLTATPGVQNVSLIVGGQSANAVTVAVAARVTGLAPVKGPVGTPVTLSGSNFGASQGSSTVSIGGQIASVSSWSSTQIIAMVPGSLGAVAHSVVVTVSGLASNAGFFTVTPGISALTPSAGSGGTVFSVSGSNFGAAQFSNTVTMNVLVLPVSTWSNNSIQVTLPDTITAGTHYVVVTVGGVASSTKPFLVLPQITQLSASSAPAGTALTITGTNFGAVKGASTLTIGGVAASVSSWSQTQIVAAVPALGLGAQEIALTVGGQMVTSPFTVIPGITSLTPDGGIGITSVTIQGTNFGTSQGTSVVNFGASIATVTTWSDTAIIVDVPAGLPGGAQNVSVVVAGLTSNMKTFALTPGLSTRSPASGTGGTPVTLTGSNFGTSQGASVLSIGGAATTAVSWSNTSITVGVPPTAEPGTQDIVLTVGGQTSNALQITIAPSLSAFEPALGPVGAAVTLRGTNLGAAQGASTVDFGGVSPAISGWSALAIELTVPAALTGGAKTATVTAGGLTSNTAAFTVHPGITGISPAAGTGGDFIGITGTNFTNSSAGNSLTIGGVAAAVNSWNDTGLIVTVPSSAEPGVRDVVATVGGRASSAVTFTVTPSITGRSPTAGAAGAPVTIAGCNFGAAQGTVTFDGAAASITSWSATSIVAQVPSAVTAGTVTVTVVAGGYARTTTFTITPAITGVSAGPFTGGELVTVTGTSFGAAQGASTVAIGGAATSPTAWSMTSITARVPKTVTAASAVGIVVTVSGQASNTQNITVKPTLLTVTPTSGIQGTALALTGTNLGPSQGVSTLTIGGVSASATGWSQQTIAVNVPAGTGAGDKNIGVTVGSQASNTLSLGVKPNVASRTPAAGTGGTAITLNGTNFGGTQGSSTVTVGGAAAVPSSWADTQIVWPIPNTAPAGVQNVVVGVNGYQSAPVTVAVQPSITLVSPSTATGGTTITITGTNFGNTKGASTLVLGGTVITPLTWSNGSITFKTPADKAGGTYGLSVTVAAQPSNDYTFKLRPSIYALSVTTQASYQYRYVTVSGANFGTDWTAGSVTVRGAAGQIYSYSWTPSQFFFAMPEGLTIGNAAVVVTVGGESSDPVNLIVQPMLYLYSAEEWAGGVIRLGGNNFGATQGTSTLHIAGVATAPTSWSDTEIWGIIPRSAARGYEPVYVTVNGIRSEQTSVYIRGRIEAMSPTQATAGDTITFTGTNFGTYNPPWCFAIIGGYLNATPSSWTNSQVTVVVPDTSAGGEQSITLYDGSNQLNAFTLTIIPRVDSVLPVSAAYDDILTIDGGGFGSWPGGNYYVTVGGVGAPVVSWTPAQIKVRVPNGVAAGNQNVIVVAGGYSASPVSVAIAPIVTSITPASGPAGAPVTILGRSFGASQGGSTVTVGGAVAVVEAWSSTLLRIQVPALANGSHAVVVTAGGLASNTASFLVSPVAPPTDLTAEPESLTSIALQWTDNAGDELSFELERKLGAGGTYAAVATLASDVTMVTDITVTSGLTYYYRVRASNAGGSSEYSNTVSATVVGVAKVAKGVTAQHNCAITTGGALYCWGANDYGQLGDGTALPQNKPQLVPGMASGVSEAAVGNSGTCAVMTSGALYCWGANYYGEIGDGTYTSSSTPVHVSAFTEPVSSVTLGGYYFTCALTRSGAAKCWGQGNYLGNGSPADRTTPTPVWNLESGVKEIGAGEQHVCALKTTGSVWCWGSGGFAQFGNGAPVGYVYTGSKPAGLDDGSGAVQLAVGGNHSCVLFSNGTVKCWGLNNYYQAGYGSSNYGPNTCGSYGCAQTPVNVTSLPAGIKSVAAGSNFTCALNASDGLLCFGSNASGELGIGTNTGPNACFSYGCASSPQNVTGLSSGVASVVPNETGACAVTTAKGIRCWGANGSGQVGNGASPSGTYTPAKVYGYANGATVSAGNMHSCGISAAGELRCWGSNGWNGFGLLGDGSGAFMQRTPVLVAGMSSGVTAVAAGDTHSCAVLSSGALYCWGYNYWGQLGINSSQTPKPTPQAVFGLSSGVRQVAVGSGDTTCAIASNGAAKCWGYGGSGQRGDGNTALFAYAPVDVVGLPSGVRSIAIGAAHGCAINAAGGVVCWGSNNYRQLGTGGSSSSTSPVPVTGLTSGYKQVAVGVEFSCALSEAGGVKCWGGNGTFQLGNGSDATSNIPVDVAGLTAGVTSISAKEDHACALLQTGSVACWGGNQSGELGDGTNVNRATPVVVSGLSSGVTGIGAGVGHTCAAKANGTLWCWGHNAYGQLGDNYTTFSPQRVVGFFD